MLAAAERAILRAASGGAAEWALARGRHRLALDRQAMSRAKQTTQPCPWCGAPVVDLEALCAKCQRSPAQHPSLANPGAAADDLGLELDLGPGRRAPAARPSAPQAAPVQSFDLDDALQIGSTSNLGASGPASVPRSRPSPGSSRTAESSSGDLGIELGLFGDAPDAAPVNMPGGRAAQAAGGDLAFGADGLDGDEVGSLEVELAGGGREQPAARTPLDASASGPASSTGPRSERAAGPSNRDLRPPQPVGLPTVDPAQVDALAGYGPPPAGILGAVPYAWRVARRRPALRRLYEAQQTTHAAVMKECRERFAAILDEQRAEWGDDPELVEDYRSLDAAQALVEERMKLLEHTRAKHAAEVGTVEHGMAALHVERAEIEKRRLAARSTQTEKDADLARTEALAKRADIELRALHDAARAAAGKDAKFAPPDHAKQIAAVEQRKAELAGTLEVKRAAARQAAEAVREVELALKALDQRIGAIDAQRRQIERQAGQVQDLRGQAVLAASNQRLELAERVVRRLHADPHRALSTEIRDQVRAATERMAMAAGELERHRLAVDAFDRATTQRGALLAIGAAVALLALLVTVVVLTRPEPPPPPAPSEFDRILEGRDAGSPRR